jgi:hypothetical protein
MADEHERRIRERAHAIWEEEGRPDGREQQHWREAERQLAAEAAGNDRRAAPDDAQIGSQGGPPADPLRNPELIPPAEDLEYPAITGPEQVPDIPGARASLNPTEIVDERSAAAPQPKRGKSGAGVRRKGGAEVPLRRRPAKSTLEP